MQKYRVSIDKIKVVEMLTYRNSALLLANDFEDLCTMRLQQEGWMIKERTGSGKMNAYRESFTMRRIDAPEGVVFLGLVRNEYRSEDEGEKQILLEWNPNKTTPPDAVLWWLDRLHAKYSYTRSIDVAFDFDDCHPLDFRIFTKRNTSTYNDGTIYVDSTAPSGAIKIYDKTAERKHHGIDLGKQVTRVEIRLKLPRYSEDSEIVSQNELAYWDDVCARLGEIYAPAEMKTRIYEVEGMHDRKADPAVLYMLKQLNHIQLQHALKLMNKKTATFYRKILKTADVERLSFDPLILMMEVLKMVDRVLEPIRQERPKLQESWYDQSKRREQRSIDDLLDELHRRIKNASYRLPKEDER